LGFRRLKTMFLTVAALATAGAMIPASQAIAGSHSGTPTYNKNVCGSRWVKIHMPKNSYFNVYNAPPGQAHTCLSVEKYHLDFQITKLDIQNPWGYPNISSGWEGGVNTCSGVKGKCFHYPVQEKKDGMPMTSVETSLSPGTYNASYDIWFNKTDAHPLQDNGTEIMIWLAHPGINDSRAIIRYVNIEGIEWGVMSWMAYNHRARTWWHYVAFMAVSQRTAVFRLWLNGFFRNAIANHELSPNWWLTGIDFGFELVNGGLHNNVHFYRLDYVN
jgi:Glycosyl hydrolase family 12